MNNFIYLCIYFLPVFILLLLHSFSSGIYKLLDIEIKLRYTKINKHKSTEIKKVGRKEQSETFEP